MHGSSIGPETQLFSVNQYRQGVAPYLGRTLRMVMFRGELAFGIEQEGAGFIPTLEQFIENGGSRTDAVAFVDPATFEDLRRAECADAAGGSRRPLGRRRTKVSMRDV